MCQTFSFAPSNEQNLEHFEANNSVNNENDVLDLHGREWGVKAKTTTETELAVALICWFAEKFK